GMASIGGETDSGETNNRFRGSLDEIKIFDGVVSETQLQEICDNERAGKNYDGTNRVCQACAIDPIHEWRLDECVWDYVNNDVQDNIGSVHLKAFYASDTSDVNPFTCRYGIFNDGDTKGRLQGDGFNETLDSSVSIIAWINTSSAQSGNARIIEFSNSANTPHKTSTAITYHSDTKELKAWTTDASGTRKAEVYYNAPGVYNDGNWHMVSYVYDGSRGILYVDDTEVGRTNGSSTDLYDINQASIGGYYERDAHFFRGNIDEVKFYNDAIPASQITTIYNADKAAKNTRTCNVCAIPEDPVFKFDAWDTFRDINDRNISTKLSAQNFNLTLASLNETNDNYQEFNGTLCSQIVDTLHGNSTQSSWVKSLFTETNTTTASFNVSSALKNAKVNLIWKSNVDETCPLTDEDNSTLSSDNVAVRPNQFNIIPTGPYYAGELFNIVASAYNINNTATQDYNETQLGGSFTIDGNETRLECIAGSESFSIADADFSNGVTPSIDANFTGIATYLNLKIHENNGSEFALVDSDDTSDALRLISAHDVNITVNPYELNVTLTEINASTDSTWLYMADVNDMNISLHVKLQANNRQNIVLKDFNSSCYAQDVNILLGATSDGVATTDMNYSAVLGTFSDGSTFKNETLNDINYTMTIPASTFNDGVGKTEMALNVNRKFHTPLKPFKIGGLSATITSSGIAKELNHDTNLDDSNISLFYGRLRAVDIKTSQNPATNKIEIEVYDNSKSSYTSSMKQNSLSWYRNEDHSGTIFGNAISIEATDTTTYSNPVNFTVPTSDISDPSSGVIDLNLVKQTGRHILHVKTQPWLWYIPKDFGSDYSDIVDSKCTEHPCFIYVFENASTTQSISTGTYKGGSATIHDSGQQNKKGVKVFR
ncbi:MAG: LamG domain-containing protein, partial [Campylobacterota bacterium]|nr:LamG domain-containing protein [Campylobacterota bacterium]